MRQPPFNPAEFRDVDRALISAAGFESGIVPIEHPEHDMTRILSQLPAEESLKMKRRFRKLWRKMVKAEKKPGVQAGLARQAGMGAKKPTKAQKLARKRLVYAQLWREIIAPALERFEAAKQDPPQGI